MIEGLEIVTVMAPGIGLIAQLGIHRLSALDAPLRFSLSYSCHADKHKRQDSRVTRHKRISELSRTDHETLLRASAEYYERVSSLMIRLRPVASQYQALLKLNQQINQTIREVIGDDPPWTRR